MRDRTSSRTATISLIVIFILCSFLPVTAETAADPIDQPGIDAPPPIEVTAEVPAEPVVDATAEVQAEPVMEAVTEVPAEPVADAVPEVPIEPVAEPLPNVIAEPLTHAIPEPIVEAVTVVSVAPLVQAAPVARPLLYKIEAFSTLGMAFYGDLAGFKAELGAQFVLGDRFAIESEAKNIVLGASLLYETIPNAKIPVTITGLDLRFGYRFFLPDFLPVPTIRIIPSLLTGPMYQSVERSSREIYRGLAWHLAPSISLDVSPFGNGKLQALKAGLNLGYNFYLSKLSLQNFHAGLFASWTF